MNDARRDRTADKPGPAPATIRIRVKERVDRAEARGMPGRPERALIIIIGACLGLGIGYLLAGMMVAFLRPAPRAGRPGAAPSTPIATVKPAAGSDIDFDFPSDGK